MPGLRREEVAMLARVSPAYYTRLEQGDGGRVSDEIVGALAQALRLTGGETDHAFRLANPRGEARRDGCSRAAVRPALQGLLDAFVDMPALIVGRRSDILAWNGLGSLVFGGLREMPRPERNLARLVFLDPAFRDLFVDWERKAADVVGLLRLDAGFHPGDPRLSALVGELAVKSDTFAWLWARHEIQERCHETQTLRHPEVGLLDLQVETLRVVGEEDKSLVTYRAVPGSATQDSLRLLGSWAVVRAKGGPEARADDQQQRQEAAVQAGRGHRSDGVTLDQN